MVTLVEQGSIGLWPVDVDISASHTVESRIVAALHLAIVILDDEPHTHTHTLRS
jgi:hypothetical protein